MLTRMGARKDRKQHSRVFWRFLASYFILAFGILAFAGVFLSNSVTSRLRQELNAIMSSNMEMVRDFMEARLTELDRIAYEVDKDVDFMAYRLFTDGYDRMRATKRLGSYRSANAYIAEIVCCYSDEVASLYDCEPLVFTAGGSFTQETFWNYFYPFDAKLREDFLTGLSPGDRPQFRTVTMTDRIGQVSEQYAYMMPMGAFNQRGMLLFLLDKQAVDAIIAPVLEESGGRLLVLDGDGRDLLHLASAADTLLPAVADDVAIDRSGAVAMEEVDDGNGRAMRISIYSDSRDWRFILDVPAKNYNANLHQQMYGYYLWILPVAFLGFVLAYLLSLQSYRPIRKMLDVYTKTGDRTDISLLGVANALEELGTTNTGLKTQLQHQAVLSRKQLISNLIHGRYSDRAALGNELALCGVRFHRQYLLVLTLYAAQQPAGETLIGDTMPGLAADVETILVGKDISCWGVMDGQGEALAFVLNVDDRDRLEMLLTDALSALAKQYLQQHGIRLAAGVGTVCEDLLALGGSYSRAVDAASFRFVDAQRVVFGASQTDGANGQALDWYAGRCENLTRLLAESKQQEAAREIGWVEENIKAHGLSPDIAKSILLEMTAAVQMSYSVLGISPDPQAQSLLERLRAVRHNTMEEYTDELVMLCYCLGHQVALLQQKKAYQLKEAVDQYLATHFNDCEMTLTDIANHFGISPNHLTRYYKQYSGMPLMRRLNTLRLAHARDLLLETDLSLDDIIHRSGFVDKNHFISRFKQQYGVPPITYRKNKQRHVGEPDGKGDSP